MVYMGRIGRVSEPGVQSSGGSSPSSSSSKLYYYNPKTNSYSTQKIAGQTGVTKGNIGKSAATPSKPSSTPSKKLYFNPQTGTYSTQKIAGQPAVTKQQAKQLSTQTQQIESQQGIREVGGFNTPQADTLGLSSSNFQSGQAQFKGRSELSISSFGSPTFIRQKQGMSSLSTPTISAGSISPPKFQTGGAKFTTRDNIAGSGITTFDSPTFISEGEPRGSSVFLTEPLVRRIVEKTTPTFLKLKTRFYNLPRGKKFKASFEKDYIDIQSMSARHKALEKAGVIDAKGTLGTSTAFKSRSDKIADFDFKVKGVFTDVLAKATTRLKKTSQEDIITVGSLAGDTAAIVYPTTRILSIGGDVARGSKFISSLPTGLKGAAKLGTYIGEMEAFRKIALDVLDYKQTELGRQYTDFVGYLQAESFANIEGGGIMKTLAGTKKKITAGKYMKTRLYPGFVEGSVGYNVLMDSEGGQIDVKSIGIPFTKASFPIPEFSLGGGLFPGKTEKGTFKTGRILDTLLVGGTGSIMAASFAGLEYVARGSKIGKPAVSTVGYLADPMELPGDIYTKLGGVSKRSTTKIPSISFIGEGINSQTDIKTKTKTDIKTGSKIKTKAGTLPFAPAKTDFTPLTKVPTTSVREKTKGTIGTGANIPSTVPAMVPATVPTNIPAMVPATVPAMVPATVPTNIPSLASSTIPVTNFVFTPNLFIPAKLPGGGGGFGGRYKPKSRSYRATKYAPSVVGMVTGSKRTKGLMTGLGVRGIETAKKQKKAKKKKDSLLGLYKTPVFAF